MDGEPKMKVSDNCCAGGREAEEVTAFEAQDLI